MSVEKPWLAEPDRLEWRDPFTGYDCMLRRVPMSLYLGHLCGYVRVPEDHPLYGLGRHDPVPRRLSADLARVLAGPAGKRGVVDMLFGGHNEVWTLLNAHGGVTWAKRLPDDPGWWFGFDCGHAGDLMPGMLLLFPESIHTHRSRDVYRTVEYVQGECASLAAQLHRLATPAPLLLGFDPATLTEIHPTDDRQPS